MKETTEQMIRTLAKDIDKDELIGVMIMVNSPPEKKEDCMVKAKIVSQFSTPAQMMIMFLITEKMFGDMTRQIKLKEKIDKGE